MFRAWILVGLFAAGCASGTQKTPLADKAYVGEAAKAPAYPILGGQGTAFLAVNEESCGATGASFGLLELQPGTVVPPHVHSGSAEILYTTSGTGVLTMGAVEAEMRPGIVVYIPAGREHAFKVTGSETWRATQVYTPGGPEARFRSAAAASRPRD